MNKLSTVMKNHDVSRKTKVMLVKSLVYPVMLYGAESWTLKMNDKRRINAFELWYWRRVLRIPWTAKVRNTEVIAIINPTSSLEALVPDVVIRYIRNIAIVDYSPNFIQFCDYTTFSTSKFSDQVRIKHQGVAWTIICRCHFIYI